jgi:hypothetical protein
VCRIAHIGYILVCTETQVGLYMRPYSAGYYFYQWLGRMRWACVRHVTGRYCNWVLARSLGQATAFGCAFPPKFCRNVYVLAIADHYPATIEEALNDVASKQSVRFTVTVEVWIVKRNINTQTDIEEQQLMFYQVRFIPVDHPSSPEPVACCVVDYFQNVPLTLAN